jgi:hypothetical protein
MEKSKLGIRAQLEKVLARPFIIMVQEPMLIACTVYMSVRMSCLSFDCGLDKCSSQFMYGSLYLMFEAIPIVFTEGHHFNLGETGLVFLPLPIGGLIAVILVSLPSSLSNCDMEL